VRWAAIDRRDESGQGLKLRKPASIVSTEDLVPEEELPNMGTTPVGLVTRSIRRRRRGRRTRPSSRLAEGIRPKSIPDFLSADGWVGMDAIYQVISRPRQVRRRSAMTILKTYKNAIRRRARSASIQIRAT